MNLLNFHSSIHFDLQEKIIESCAFLYIDAQKCTSSIYTLFSGGSFYSEPKRKIISKLTQLEYLNRYFFFVHLSRKNQKPMLFTLNLSFQHLKEVYKFLYHFISAFVNPSTRYLSTFIQSSPFRYSPYLKSLTTKQVKMNGPPK